MMDDRIAIYLRISPADHLALAQNAASIGTSRNALVIAAIRMMNDKLDAGVAAADAVASAHAAQRHSGKRRAAPKP